MNEELKKMKQEVDLRIKETITSLFEKAQELREERVDIIKNRKAKLTSLKRKFDTRITRLTIDIARFENSAKILVGSKKYAELKSAFVAEQKKKTHKSALVDEPEKKVVEKKDPILLEAERRNL